MIALANEPISIEQARVNITHAGLNGELPETVFYRSDKEQIRAWVTEALRTGSIPGIPEDPRADIADYSIETFDADEATPYNRIFVRPKTVFG